MKIEIRGLSVSTRAVSRSVSCLQEIIPDFLTFLCNNRLGDGFFDLRELCLPLCDDLDSRNFSFREIRRSHQPISSNYLIEINGCVLLQSNSENFFTENVILNAFSLALSHVKIVIQCLLSKLYVEEVVSVLTPVVTGVAQAFNDLLVELRLLLVAEVEEREEEDRQEEGWEVECGVRRVKERQPLTCMAWRWGERCKTQT